MKKIYTYTYGIFLCTLLLVIGCSEDTIDTTATGSITGTVVIDGSNTPIADVKVSTNPSSSTVFTNEDGAFVIPNVLIGGYAVQAEKDDLVTSFEQATVLEGLPTNVVFELKAEGSDNTPPSIPLLITPADGETGVSLSPTFVWTSEDPDEFDTVTYRLELRGDTTNEIKIFENIVDTMLTVQGLSFGTKYFWQVQADDNTNLPVNSALSTFETTESPNNRVLYVRKIDGNNVVFSTSEVGENDLQLTSSNQNSWRPRKIVGTNRIAFLRTVGNDAQIFTMNEDGSGINQVTDETPVNGFDLDELDYTFGFDGLIYYPNFTSLYSIRLDGTGLGNVYTTTDGSLISEVAARPESTDEFAIKTNNINGYNISIDVINIVSDTIIETIFSGDGGAGGLDFDATGDKLLYAYDVSDLMLDNYNIRDSKIFIYDFATMISDDISEGRPTGTNDLDPRFSPTDAQVIVTNKPRGSTSSIPDLVIISFDNGGVNDNREEIKTNAFMPDWE